MSRVWRRVSGQEQREQRRTTTAPQRTENPPRTLEGPRREATGGDAVKVQGPERRRAPSSLEDDLTYAEVTSGRRSSSPRIEMRVEEPQRTTSPERGTENLKKDGPWEEVRRRKHHRSPTSGEAARMEKTRVACFPDYYPTRRSPPTKRTSSGVVEVCGKCRQPGHHAVECRRQEVCRTCERPGHRAVHCPVPSSMMSTLQAYENEQLKMKGKKRKTEREMGEGSSLGNEQKEEQLPRRKAEPVKEESNKVSTAIDEGMVQEIQQLRSYTIATGRCKNPTRKEAPHHNLLQRSHI
ncbi:hypothetical protein J5N97_028974 [Dioscorea zingiberensis]|uniref:CCHC-type domain-containing protein n=1 Tax=Dioscorea zingiberensis TaxID=325984 RepID=A0A9D5C0K5_9LILI|nr:hypothetical protein J5N97_028974 [Dioscorea zingiberensis]